MQAALEETFLKMDELLETQEGIKELQEILGIHNNKKPY